jgi:hypothetical protein
VGSSSLIFYCPLDWRWCMGGWLVHPIDRTLAIYQLEAGRYGRASILELKGKTPIAAVPGITIDWDEVLVKIS